MNHEVSVVRERTTAKIKSSVLDQLTIWSGLPPSAHHGALHLNKLSHHVDSPESFFHGITITLHLLLVLRLVADAVGNALDFIEDVGWVAFDVVLLHLPDELSSSAEGLWS